MNRGFGPNFPSIAFDPSLDGFQDLSEEEINNLIASGVVPPDQINKLLENGAKSDSHSTFSGDTRLVGFQQSSQSRMEGINNLIPSGVISSDQISYLLQDQMQSNGYSALLGNLSPAQGSNGYPQFESLPQNGPVKTTVPSAPSGNPSFGQGSDAYPGFATLHPARGIAIQTPPTYLGDHRKPGATLLRIDADGNARPTYVDFATEARSQALEYDNIQAYFLDFATFQSNKSGSRQCVELDCRDLTTSSRVIDPMHGTGAFFHPGSESHTFDRYSTGAHLGARDERSMVIGGTTVKNLSLIIAGHDSQGFVDLPVRTRHAAGDKKAELVVPTSESKNGAPALPVLTVPCAENPDKRDDEEKAKEGSGRATLEEYVMSGDIEDLWGIKGLSAKLYKYKGPENVETLDDDKKRKDDDKEKVGEENNKDEPARERVKINTESLALGGKPLQTLLNLVDLPEINDVPIENLMLTYSEEKINPLFAPGLRLEVDVPFKNGLQWAGDAIRNLLGPHSPVTSIHLSAHLSDTRDWSKRPKIKKLVLQGYFENMFFKAWDILEFQTMGVEITASRAGVDDMSKDAGNKKGESKGGSKPLEQTDDDESAENPSEDADETSKDEGISKNKNDGEKGKGKKSWYFGFALIGRAIPLNLPHANAPTEMTYRIARDFVPASKENDKKADTKEETKDDAQDGADLGNKSEKRTDETKKNTEKNEKHKREWNFVLTADKWENIYDIKRLTLSEAKLKTSFNEGKFRDSVKLELSAKLKLGDGTFDVEGHFTKDDHLIKAEIRDLELSDIKKIHAQITGQGPASDHNKDETNGHDLTFKKIELSLSRKKSTETDTVRNSLELNGHVTFNEHVSATASLVFASEGLKITGGISDFKIPETEVTVEKAGLEIFIAFKHDHKKTKSIADGDKTEAQETDKAKSDDEAGNGTAPENSNKAVVPKSDKGIDSKKRESKFALLGVVKIGSLTAKIGFYIERKKDKKERDWLVFGAVEGIRLRDAWQEIPADSFLNLQLENIAVIASSEKRAQKRQGNNPSAQGDSKDADSDDKETKEESENWDVQSQVDLYNYPIVKGVQLCATISGFPQLEDLNGKKKIDGLTLVISIDSNGKFDVKVHLPKSFEVKLSDTACLGEFETGLSLINSRPEIHLGATLTLTMKDSDPIYVKGVIVGDPVGASGELRMEKGSKWANPFNLNKNLIFSNLGVGAGFTYATVLVTGPTSISLSGRVDIGDFNAQLDAGIDVKKADLVFKLNINHLDVIDVIKMTGTLIECDALKKMEGMEGKIVFDDILVYVSSGAELLGEYFPRGIKLRGNARIFDKTGDFDASFDESGVSLKAGIDNFKIGDLEVCSTRVDEGVRRASIDVTITKDAQKVFVDGMIRYHDLKLKILINANLQERYLLADVSLDLAQGISIALKAQVYIPNSNSLEGAVADFEATLDLDVVGVIFDGIKNGIESFRQIAKRGIDGIEADMQRQIDADQSRVDELKKNLAAIKKRSDEELARKKAKISDENAAIFRLQAELTVLEENYNVAKMRRDNKKAEIDECRRNKDRVQGQLDDKIRELSSDYSMQINAQAAEQQRLEARKQELLNLKELRFGDLFRSVEYERALREKWEAEETGKWQWKVYCENKVNTGDIFDKASWGIKLAAASLALEATHAGKSMDMAAQHALAAAMETPAMREITDGLQEVSEGIVKFGMAVNKLSSQGLYGYVHEMSTDFRQELQSQVDIMDQLIQDHQRLENALRSARSALEAGRGKFNSKMAKARENIAQMEADLEVKPHKLQYDKAILDHSAAVSQVKAATAMLEEVRNDLNQMMCSAEDVAEAMKQGIPRITEIVVKASTDAFVKDKPLTFEFHGEWVGQKLDVVIIWSPTQSLHELYRSAIEKMVTDGK